MAKPTQISPSAPDAATRACAAIASAARHLDERERRIVLLLYFCDYTQAETAQRLGRPSEVREEIVMVRPRRRWDPPPAPAPPIRDN